MNNQNYKPSLVLTALLINCISYAQDINIAFFINALTVRGTEVAIFDYADFNETILKNNSFIINYIPSSRPLALDFHSSVQEKFQKRFGYRYYECTTLEEMDTILLQNNIKLIHIAKSGSYDGIISQVCKNAIHAMFPDIQPHGDHYATLSPWLSKLYPELRLPYVPCMVRLDPTTETLHTELNIPRTALVFGRHGGIDSFDIPFVQETICEVAQNNPSWYFIFLNTHRFCSLANVIFLPATADMNYKTKFINTCTAMIHARSRGETFGLACAEFSIQNKPVITYAHSPERSHIEILQDKGFFYANKQELLTIFNSIAHNRESIQAGHWDAYSEHFNPEAVIKKFNEVFIQPCIQKQ